MESVSPNVSVSSMSDDTESNDNIDGHQNVQLPDDEDDFRSLMDEIPAQHNDVFETAYFSRTRHPEDIRNW